MLDGLGVACLVVAGGSAGFLVCLAVVRGVLRARRKA
jgi:hypothetical protein